MSMETNLPTKADAHLTAAAEKLLAAAMEYFEAHRRATGGAAVVWLTDTDGRMVVLTRGEYRGVLMNNIEALQRDTVRGFGAVTP